MFRQITKGKIGMWSLICLDLSFYHRTVPLIHVDTVAVLAWEPLQDLLSSVIDFAYYPSTHSTILQIWQQHLNTLTTTTSTSTTMTENLLHPWYWQQQDQLLHLLHLLSIILLFTRFSSNKKTIKFNKMHMKQLEEKKT